ncbi:MAG: hypothetical protein NC206_08070 [Bacteroides sp.]|nr:hypothetical protein [Roseburia sp.]MCM1347025.1 hypothetical protein [Bacteroides sp.]MCM1420324.1 hypothetical protein [Bacteroides sp.]
MTQQTRTNSTGIRAYIRAILIAMLLLLCPQAKSAEYNDPLQYQWVIGMDNGTDSEAFLWIPPACERLNALVFSQQNMTEETLFGNRLFLRRMEEAGVGILWFAPGLWQQWNVQDGCQEQFYRILHRLADVSGYVELDSVPIVPIGHSAMATFPWNFGAWNKERTLCIISYKGDAPRTNLCGYGRENLEWGRNRNIDGVPGLMIMGEYEWWDLRLTPAHGFRMWYPNSLISFLCDAERGHFDLCDETADYVGLFIQKALDYRRQRANGTATEGWYAQRWGRDDGFMPVSASRPKPAPCSEYQGDEHIAFWYFDKEMAETAEKRYAHSAGKKMQYVSFMQNGQVCHYNPDSHVKLNPQFMPDADGITFHLKAVCVDSTNSRLSDEHAQGTASIQRICGPVETINDTTFRLAFYHTGMSHPRYTHTITMFAEMNGDEQYKTAVREVSIRIPERITDGREQTISLKKMNRQLRQGSKTTLRAESSSGLPVRYYVKCGAAHIENGNKLVMDRIPPRAKLPMRVTVVAWQYGISGKWNTAEPVEIDFESVL